MTEKTMLIHLGSGMGNMLLATPMIRMLSDNGFTIDLCVQGETPGVEPLFEHWPHVRRVSADPTVFCSNRYGFYVYGFGVAGEPIQFANREQAVVLHPSWDWGRYDLYSEIEMYTNIARAMLPDAPVLLQPECGAPDVDFPEITAKTCVLAPGGQREFVLRKWPWFDQLAERFDDAAVVGTPGDLDMSNRVVFPGWARRVFGNRLNYPGRWWRLAKSLAAERLDHSLRFPEHVKNYIGKLSLPETAALIRQAGFVVANDCGLAHLAISLGKPTFVIMGPSSRRKNFPAFLNDTFVISKSFDCQPCQETPGMRVWRGSFGQCFCPNHLQCMNEVTVDDVIAAIDKGLAGFSTADQRAAHG